MNGENVNLILVTIKILLSGFKSLNNDQKLFIISSF